MARSTKSAPRKRRVRDVGLGIRTDMLKALCAYEDRHPDERSLTVRELAAAVDRVYGTISHHLRVLEMDGYIIRESGRQRNIRVTAKGRDVCTPDGVVTS